MAEVEQPPGWLPDGWIMEVREGENGSIFKYYICPISDYIFCKEEEVLLYLGMVNDGCQEHETMVEHVVQEYSNEAIDESVQIVQRIKDLVDWMPRGWIMEIRRQGDKHVGQMYKCYIHQVTGSTFYSKEEALQFLQSLNEGNQSAHPKVRRSHESNAIAQIEYSPDGVPQGWIRKNTYRGSNGTSATRKDPYYLDPESGFVFRTQKDVALFDEYGIVSKYAFRPRKNGMFDMLLVGSLNAPKASRLIKSRSSEHQIPKLEWVPESDKKLKKTEIPCSSSYSPHRTMNEEGNNKRKKDQEIDNDDEKLSEFLKYSKGKGNKTVEKLPKVSDDMSTPLKTFFRKAKKCVPKVHNSNLSGDKSSEKDDAS